MKYKPKIYAQTIAELIIEKKSEKIHKNFLKILLKNGDFKKAKEIMILAEKILLRKTKKRKIVLELARERSIKNLHLFYQESDLVKKMVNPELLAGIKVTMNEEWQLDYSLKGKLDQLFISRSNT